MPARRANSLLDWINGSEKELRSQLESKSVRRSSQKYMGVTIHPAPDGWYVGRDRDDVFDTVKDAKDFIRSYSKTGMRMNPGLDPISGILASDIMSKVTKGNVAAGFVDEDGVFHPIRASFDYSAKRAGESKKAAKPKRRRKKANSPHAAAAAFENFHGMPSENVTESVTRIDEPTHFWELGKLLEIVVRYELNGKDYDVVLSGFKGALLIANKARTQLYVEGGDQSVNLSEFGIEKPYHEYEDLGRAVMFAYRTTKLHLGKDGGKNVDFVHCIERCARYEQLGLKQIPKSAEGAGPTVVYDVRNKLLQLSGGSYTIPDEGIEY